MESHGHCPQKKKTVCAIQVPVWPYLMLFKKLTTPTILISVLSVLMNKAKRPDKICSRLRTRLRFSVAINHTPLAPLYEWDPHGLGDAAIKVAVNPLMVTVTEAGLFSFFYFSHLYIWNVLPYVDSGSSAQ